MESRHVISIIILNVAFFSVLILEGLFIQEASAIKNLVYSAIWIGAQSLIWGGVYFLENRKISVKVK